MMTIVVFLGAGMLALAVVAAVFDRDRQLKRAAARLALTPLGDVPEGRRVKVSGVVDATSAKLTAPISGRACAAWTWTRASARWSGSPRPTWSTSATSTP